MGATENSLPSNYVLPRSSGMNADVGFSYTLSPRTTFGLDGGEYMIWNRFQHARGTIGSVSLGHKMSERWFLRVYGGGALTQTMQSAGSRPAQYEITGGGSLGVKTHAQTLAATYDRSTYDSFGFAAGLITSESASWSWQHPGSRWSASASFSEEQMRDTGFASISGWQAGGGIAIRLQSQTMLQLQYAHLRSAGRYTGTFNQLEFDSIRVSLGWAPFRLAH